MRISSQDSGSSSSGRHWGNSRSSLYEDENISGLDPDRRINVRDVVCCLCRRVSLPGTDPADGCPLCVPGSRFLKTCSRRQPPSWDHISRSHIAWSSVPKSLLHILCGCHTFSSRTANLFMGLYFDMFQTSMSMGIRSLPVHHRTTLSGNQ
jgi:hypothetical protein